MKFNAVQNRTTKTTNHEGALAYEMSAEMELYTAVVTASLSNKFYEKEVDSLARIQSLIPKVNPVFVAKLAIYAREQMYFRSIPLVLVVELAKIHAGDSLVKNTIARVVKRADEITELLAYYQLANERTYVKKLNKLSKQVQKGLGQAFNKFDEYQFAKYNRKGTVTLKDALFLVHPKAKDEAQQILFNKVATDELKVPYTWEVELSTLGQESFKTDIAKAKAVQAKWEELIESGKLGYMALMRNLRNILTAEVGAKYIKIVGKRLADPTQIHRAKQLPFRYLAAYRELKNLKFSYVSYILDVLERAIQVSAENIKGFGLDTRILLASDVSSSMWSPISARSTIRCYDIGLMLSMLMRNRSDNVTTGIFGDTWKAVDLPKNNILANADTLNKIEGKVGYSTNGYKVINWLINERQVMDKVMFFTDLQMWDSYGDTSLKQSWKRYKAIAPNAKLYLFDLQGYGQTPLSLQENDVYLIAGWSNKVFDILATLEKGNDAIHAIESLVIK